MHDFLKPCMQLRSDNFNCGCRQIPRYFQSYQQISYTLTSTTESRAAMARISAQDTVRGQAISSSDLIPSIKSKPLSEFKLGPAVFSPTSTGVSSRSTEASQP